MKTELETGGDEGEEDGDAEYDSIETDENPKTLKLQFSLEVIKDNKTQTEEDDLYDEIDDEDKEEEDDEEEEALGTIEAEPYRPEPEEIKSDGEKFDAFIEMIRESDDLESLKFACVSSLMALKKQVDKAGAGGGSAPAPVGGPPPPPPPGPPPPGALSQNSNKLVIKKVPRPEPVAAAPVNFLLDEIKKKQFNRGQRDSLRKKYTTLK